MQKLRPLPPSSHCNASFDYLNMKHPPRKILPIHHRLRQHLTVVTNTIFGLIITSQLQYIKIEIAVLVDDKGKKSIKVKPECLVLIHATWCTCVSKAISLKNKNDFHFLQVITHSAMLLVDIIHINHKQSVPLRWFVTCVGYLQTTVITNKYKNRKKDQESYIFLPCNNNHLCDIQDFSI